MALMKFIRPGRTPTFPSRDKAEKHECEIQYFKRH
jgi:hypothetical protein